MYILSLRIAGMSGRRMRPYVVGKFVFPKLKEFFVSMTRQSFDQLGVGDRQIVDYVASILTDFSHADRWRLLRDAEGRRLTSAVEMLIAQLGPNNSNRILGERALRKHIGDYTLFMSGLFRNFVERGGYLRILSRRRKTRLSDGIRTGCLALSAGLSDVRGAEQRVRELRRRAGLHAQVLLRPFARRKPFAGFLKQIEGWMRPGLSDN